MERSRQWAQIVGLAGIGVLLLWKTVGADHRVTFLQTNNQEGGTAIVGRVDNATTNIHGPIGIWGQATSGGTGDTTGVRGDSFSQSGVGVRGKAQAVSGSTKGVIGEANSPSGIGVFGFNGATTGFTRGVYGQVASPDGTGVRGWATATTGSTNGVQGLAVSPVGRGVFGDANATTGASKGVYGRTASSTGTGVFGEATSTTNAGSLVAYGVRGKVASAYGIGVAGYGRGQGVRGEATAPWGVGVLGVATGRTGETRGVQGNAESPDGVAIRGFATNGAKAGQFLGDVEIGAAGAPGGHLFVHGNHIADVAEDMPVLGPVSAGDVVIIQVGKRGYGVARGARSYDTRVAGIVSDAPRIHLQVGPPKGMAPIAVAGVVRAKATARNGTVRVGDLLTTSTVPGHLMRCPRPSLCVGAIVGKALQPVKKGERQILVLLWRQ